MWYWLGLTLHIISRGSMVKPELLYMPAGPRRLETKVTWPLKVQKQNQPETHMLHFIGQKARHKVSLETRDEKTDSTLMGEAAHIVAMIARIPQFSACVF